MSMCEWRNAISRKRWIDMAAVKSFVYRVSSDRLFCNRNERNIIHSFIEHRSSDPHILWHRNQIVWLISSFQRIRIKYTHMSVQNVDRNNRREANRQRENGGAMYVVT